MPISTISVKGQVTLPVRMRRKLGIGPNDKVVIESVDDAIIIKRAADFFELEGFLGESLPEAEEQKSLMRAAAARTKGTGR